MDDFGTGFSNFDIIMRLPFNVIKFDRSLLLSAANNDEMKFMVKHFSKIFKYIGYTLLFEGIENDADENFCKSLEMTYMQGYKYSKPIKIEELTNFLRGQCKHEHRQPH